MPERWSSFRSLLTTVTEVGRAHRAAGSGRVLRNAGPRIHFAILSDFVDAPNREMPEDAALLEAARNGIEALNEPLWNLG